MKTILFLVGMFLALPLLAEEPESLKRLREQRDAKLKAATEPIRAEYVQKLEGLYKALADAGNIEGAEAVAKARQSMGGNPSPVKLEITGTSWSNGAGAVVSFQKDEVCILKGKATTKSIWRQVGSQVVWGAMLRVATFEDEKMLTVAGKHEEAWKRIAD